MQLRRARHNRALCPHGAGAAVDRRDDPLAEPRHGRRTRPRAHHGSPREGRDEAAPKEPERGSAVREVRVNNHDLHPPVRLDRRHLLLAVLHAARSPNGREAGDGEDDGFHAGDPPGALRRLELQVGEAQRLQDGVPLEQVPPDLGGSLVRPHRHPAVLGHIRHGVADRLRGLGDRHRRVHDGSADTARGLLRQEDLAVEVEWRRRQAPSPIFLRASRPEMSYRNDAGAP